jgi:hypothetical protein
MKNHENCWKAHTTCLSYNVAPKRERECLKMRQQG